MLESFRSVPGSTRTLFGIHTLFEFRVSFSMRVQYSFFGMAPPLRELAMRLRSMWSRELGVTPLRWFAVPKVALFSPLVFYSQGGWASAM